MLYQSGPSRKASEQRPASAISFAPSKDSRTRPPAPSGLGHLMQDTEIRKDGETVHKLRKGSKFASFNFPERWRDNWYLYYLGIQVEVCILRCE
jgi:hypothetical protein